MTTKAFTILVQTRLGVTPDGEPGNITLAALDKALPPKQQPKPDPTPEAGLVDDRSERVISTLHARLRDKARQLVHRAAAAGIKIKIISGLRTYDEQNALYAQGRTSSGRVVTNARGGYSNHNFGVAFDVGVFSADGKYLDESPSYKTVGQLGKSLGFEWGGDWSSIQDQPHFQLRPLWAVGMRESEMLAEMRRRKSAGVDVF
jgi:peptidoglycan L-alanyl-D-glutamate endopeptidase CwlK